jgi:hypothetical protein
MFPYLSETIADERRRELIAEAARARLIALATCCRESGLGRAARRLRGAWKALAAPSGGSCCATV